MKKPFQLRSINSLRMTVMVLSGVAFLAVGFPANNGQASTTNETPAHANVKKHESATALVAIAQEKAPAAPTPSTAGATPAAIGNPTPSSMWTPTPSQLETITPSVTPPMAGTPRVSGKPAQRRRTPGAQTTPTAPYSTTPAPDPGMTAP